MVLMRVGSAKSNRCLGRNCRESNFKNTETVAVEKGVLTIKTRNATEAGASITKKQIL